MLAAEHLFQFDQPFEEYFIKTPDGETLNALLFKSPNTPKGFILYFHGNAGNLQRWGNYAIDFTELDYDILMVEYRGYGKSTGTPSEVDFYADAQVVLDWAKANIPFSRLIIYGRSLGSGVATQLAIKNSPDLLILETPFNELKKPLLSQEDRFFIIEGGGHRNLNKFKEFREGLAEVLN